MKTVIVILSGIGPEAVGVMAGEVRERMIAGAMALLARRGLSGASFSDVLSATGAPRGSLYHHFPNGKAELVAAAVERAGLVLAEALAPVAGASAEAVVERFLVIWRTVLTRSDCEAGCAVMAVAAAPESADMLAQAASVFRAWSVQLTDLLSRGGVSPGEASGFAVMMIASVEGAVALSRAERSLEPFEAVARQLVRQARLMMSKDSAD
jgi:TetR/AcrR family transcriptional regulator, lmrAB and yxaGH operons repressor